MKFKLKLIYSTLGCFLAFVVLPSDLHAQRRGGGGARPSMGNVGGGGGRPSMGGSGGFSRPNIPNSMPSRPATSLGGGNRPSLSNVSQPSLPSARPSTPNIAALPAAPSGSNLGGFHPGGGGRPTTSLPNAIPGVAGANPPNVKPPTSLIPSTRPSSPERPNLGGIDRPTTLPGSIGAGQANSRPSIGNLNRPTTLPGNLANSRPNINQPSGIRPGNNSIASRPVIGAGGNKVNIGSGDRTLNSNRINTGMINNGNINVGNTINIGIRGGNFVNTRPAWDQGFYNPGWGLGNSWTGSWHNHCINGHYGWYNGCWNHGYWGSSWYRPVAWVSVGWGLSRWVSGWGYGVSYYNPYYTANLASTNPPYNYSQPVVVNNYLSTDQNAADAPQPVREKEALSTFDQGLAEFKARRYQEALAFFDKALKELPNDPVVHEVRALTLFAVGQYTSAAASLNSLLSSAPGMDWTTMSSLYGSIDDYSSQLRKLESYCQAKPTDSAAYFVLAYHYLVVGSKDNAIAALKVVVQQQPKDATAKRMLDALVPPPSGVNALTVDPTKSTDLVGKWRASVGSSTIELEITEASEFVWKATESGQQTVKLTGQLTADNDAIVLTNEAQGAIAGVVKSLGPNQWQLLLDGAPSTDPGLSFTRVGT